MRPHMDQAEADWRRLDATDCMMYLRWLTDLTVSRQSTGRKTYGDTFQGDPLTHLAEELVDALFYCFQAWRERAKLKEKIDGQPITEYPTIE